MSNEQYKTVSCKVWQKSFYGIKDFAKGKFRHFDERVHADAFKQCVSERANYFEKYVFQIFEEEHIPAIYKLCGLDGLALAKYPTGQLLPLLWKCMDMFDQLCKDGYGYRLFRNDPTLVARAYKEALQNFRHAFKEVEFAIFCARDWTNYDVFCNVFNGTPIPVKPFKMF